MHGGPGGRGEVHGRSLGLQLSVGALGAPSMGQTEKEWAASGTCVFRGSHPLAQLRGSGVNP